MSSGACVCMHKIQFNGAEDLVLIQETRSIFDQQNVHILNMMLSGQVHG